MNVQKSNNRKNIRCGGILLNPELNQVLLILNKYTLLNGNPKWGLPKGHINDTETYAECARREIEEETGIYLPIYEKQPKIKIDNTYYFPMIINKNKNLNPKPNDTNEIAEAKWFLIKDIKSINTNRELGKLPGFINRITKLAKYSNFFKNDNKHYNFKTFNSYNSYNSYNFKKIKCF
jgi:8-oxo-dGTP pyrophosphatase MutT (NUDIX family)